MRLVTILLILSASVWADSQDSRIKSWKTLTNDNGFEFKYPDCWTPRPDNPDEMDKSVIEARDIAVEETKECARPLLNPPHQNHMGFSSGWVKTTKEESLKDIEQKERNSKSNIARKAWVFFKRTRLGPDEAATWVSFHRDVKSSWIRWETELYCPTLRVSILAPAVKDPAPSYYEKFKAGDMALPEPEKTIFESIRCTESNKRMEAKETLKLNGTEFALQREPSGSLSIQSGQTKFLGEPGKKYGNFQTWAFHPNRSFSPMEVIISNPGQRVIDYSNGDAGGPVPIGASADGNWLAIDYGTGPGEREIQIRDISGNKIFSDGYLASKEFTPKWVGSNLEYVCPAKLDRHSYPKDYEKCANVGVPNRAEWCAFEGQKHRRMKLAKPSTIVCTP